MNIFLCHYNIYLQYHYFLIIQALSRPWLHVLSLWSLITWWHDCENKLWRYENFLSWRPCSVIKLVSSRPHDTSETTNCHTEHYQSCPSPSWCLHWVPLHNFCSHSVAIVTLFLTATRVSIFLRLPVPSEIYLFSNRATKSSFSNASFTLI